MQVNKYKEHGVQNISMATPGNHHKQIAHRTVAASKCTFLGNLGPIRVLIYFLYKHSGRI